MVCEKCGGHLVPEGDYFQGEKWFGERCFACSQAYDPIIVKNRKENPKRILKIKELIYVDSQFVSLDINGIDKLYNRIRQIINGI